MAAGADKVVLTGSGDTGRRVLAKLAETLTPTTMELSGDDAMIVLPGAPIDVVARAISYGLMLNGGETCIAPRRIIAVGEIRFRSGRSSGCPTAGLAGAPRYGRLRRACSPRRLGHPMAGFLAMRPALSSTIMAPLVFLAAEPTTRRPPPIFGPVGSLISVADPEDRHRACQSQRPCSWRIRLWSRPTRPMRSLNGCARAVSS